MDPATKPQWSVEASAALRDNSGVFIVNAEFSAFKVPYVVTNWVLDSHCLIAAETTFGSILPLEK